jgi:hypothetical protein
MLGDKLKFDILQAAQRDGCEDMLRPILEHLHEFSREDIGEVWDDLPPHLALAIGKLWQFFQENKECDKRNAETMQICLQKWPGETTFYPDRTTVTGPATRPDKADSTGDSLDDLIDNLPAAPGPAPGPVLKLGDRGGRSLRDLVKLVREQNLDSHIDKKQLLLEVWQREGLCFTEKQRAWFLRYCSPPEAITRTARGF